MALVRNTADHRLPLTVGYLDADEQRNIDIDEAWEQALITAGDLLVIDPDLEPPEPPEPFSNSARRVFLATGEPDLRRGDLWIQRTGSELTVLEQTDDELEVIGTVGADLAPLQADVAEILDERLPAVESDQATLPYNVKSAQFAPSVLYLHGAIADGFSHPLSDFFASLPAAQAVYPAALDLADELDWAACMKAQAAATLTAGAVYHPRGLYRMGEREYEGGAGVYNFGDGGTASMFLWADAGLGNLAMSGAAGQANATHFYMLGFLGPRHNLAPVPGFRQVGMDGVAARSWVHMTDCYVSGFGMNIVVTGNHQKFTRVRSVFGFANWYWGDNTEAGFTSGDQSIDSCTSDFAAWCNVAVHGNNQIGDGEWRSTHLGFAPVGFHKFDTLDEDGYPATAAEVDGAVPSTAGLLVNTNLSKVSFEEQGNLCILDTSTGADAGSNSLTGCNLDGCVHTWGDTYRIDDLDRDYAIDVRVSRGTVIRTGALGFGAGEEATYRIATGGIKVIGGHHRYMFSPLGAIAEGLEVENPPFIMRAFSAAGTIAQGDILEASLSGYQVQRYAGASGGRPILGVAAHAAIAGENVMVCLPPGDAYVLSEVVAFGGLYVTAGGGGVAHHAQGVVGFSMPAAYAHEPSPEPAFAVTKTAGGAGGGALLHVTLIGLQPDAGMVWPQATPALPTASADYRGQMRVLPGGGVTPDAVVICRYDGAGGWEWAELLT